MNLNAGKNLFLFHSGTKPTSVQAPFSRACSLEGEKVVTWEGIQGVSIQSKVRKAPGTTQAKDEAWSLKGQAGAGQEKAEMDQVTPTEGPPFGKSSGITDGPMSARDTWVTAQDLKVCSKIRSKMAWMGCGGSLNLP